MVIERLHVVHVPIVGTSPLLFRVRSLEPYLNFEVIRWSPEEETFISISPTLRERLLDMRERGWWLGTESYE